MFDNEAKVTSLIMRMSKVEKSVLNALAKKENLTLSDFIRKCVYSLHSVEEINGILADLKKFARVSEKDLNFPTLSDKKSIVITLSKEQMGEIDRLAEEAGVPKVAFVRNRVINGSQTFIDIKVDYEGIKELEEKIDTFIRTNRNLIRKIERSNMVTPKDVERIKENATAQKEALVSVCKSMIMTHAKMIKTVGAEARAILKKENKKHKR